MNYVEKNIINNKKENLYLIFEKFKISVLNR